MKRLLVISALLALALAVPVTVAAPTYAKGATDVVVSGPGIDDVRLGYTRRMDDVDVGSLAEVSGIYQIYGAAITTDDPGLTTAELGPRYELTWYGGDQVMVVSHVYPFTSQGAWLNIPHEQGGWVRGGPDLEDAMVTLGARPPTVSDWTAPTGVTDPKGGATTDESAAAANGSPDDPSSALPTVAVGGVAAGVLLLLTAGAWLVRRRRPPQPVLSLSEPA